MARKPQVKKAPGKAPAKKPARVLLIDDDPDFVAATTTVLESGDYRVLTALRGDEGIRKAKDTKPDVIILDIIMPVKSGITVCDELKRDPQLSKIPVLMLTSLGQKLGETTVSVADAMTLEAEDYIEKPVAPAELLKRVARLLKRA